MTIQAYELINLAVVQGIFTEEEATKKEQTLTALTKKIGRTAKATVDSYIVKNVLTTYNQSLQERL